MAKKYGRSLPPLQSSAGRKGQGQGQWLVSPVTMVEGRLPALRTISEILVNSKVVKACKVIALVDPDTYIAAVKKAEAPPKIAKASAELQQAALQRARTAVENAC